MAAERVKRLTDVVDHFLFQLCFADCRRLLPTLTETVSHAADQSHGLLSTFGALVRSLGLQSTPALRPPPSRGYHSSRFTFMSSELDGLSTEELKHLVQGSIFFITTCLPFPIDRASRVAAHRAACGAPQAPGGAHHHRARNHFIESHERGVNRREERYDCRASENA